MELAYYCMDNPTHPMFKANVDGPRCPQCKGLVNIKPVSTERYNELPTYDSLRKSTTKSSKGIKVNILFDDNQILKLRAIAKHAEALANELDAIDRQDNICVDGMQINPDEFNRILAEAPVVPVSEVVAEQIRR